jgi:hypothetical protein
MVMNNSVIVDRVLLGSGSWLSSVLIVVNVKPEKSARIVTRIHDKFLTYSEYVSFSSVTPQPLKVSSVTFSDTLYSSRDLVGL